MARRRAPAGETFDPRLAVQASRMFFLEDRTKLEIANRLGVSRFKVARLIEGARDAGLIRIEISDPDGYDDALAESLVHRFGLAHAVVVDATGDAVQATLGRAAAQVLSGRLRRGDVLGIGWGRAVLATIQALTAEDHAVRVDVVQLAGGLPSIASPIQPTQIAATAAAILQGGLFPVHAPAYLASEAARGVLLQEPAIASSFRRFADVTIALVGIGAMGRQPASALYTASGLDRTELRQLRGAGAIGDLFGHFFDERGRIIPMFESRTVAIPAAQVPAIQFRLGVAGGANKAAAIRAALSGLLVNAIVTDVETAVAVLGGGAASALPRRRASSSPTGASGETSSGASVAAISPPPRREPG